MSNTIFLRLKSVLVKDLKSEFRTRYGMSAISLFILTSITMLIFSTGQERLSDYLYAGLLWIIMFFGSMTGLAKVFVYEEERQTSMLLKITSGAGFIYFGKLIYNILFSICINIFAVLLFLIFFGDLTVKSPIIFLFLILLGSIGIGATTTIIAAIISKAGVKNSLFTVLSFPVLLPLIIIGIESTADSFEGTSFSELSANFQLLLAYSGILIPLSYILFDMIWED
jgi:heme exporter protein B